MPVMHSDVNKPVHIYVLYTVIMWLLRLKSGVLLSKRIFSNFYSLERWSLAFLRDASRVDIGRDYDTDGTPRDQKCRKRFHYIRYHMPQFSWLCFNALNSRHAMHKILLGYPGASETWFLAPSLNVLPDILHMWRQFRVDNEYIWYDI